MQLCTPEQMQSIDHRTIEELNIPGFELMDRAGQAVAGVAQRMLGEISDKKVAIFCGKGNNGGDGLVAGRCLLQAGADVCCYLLASQNVFTGDAASHLTLAQEAGVPLATILDDDLKSMTIEADLIIDAILGTGLKGMVRGLPAAAITRVNGVEVPVLSVDIPSGLTSKCGYPDLKNKNQWPCIRADQTVTIGLMKIDLATYPGKAWGGKIEVADIGFPADAIKAENLWMSMPDREEMARLIPTYHPAEHKGDRGRVAVVAGSVGMAGAAVLTSKAAMRAGAGMTMLGAPVSLVDVMAMKMTEVMIRPLPETTARTTGLKALSNIEDMTSWADVLAIGPGLSQHQETTELVRQVVSRSPLPVVLDADGINAFINHTELFSACASDIIMTPHIGELSRLTNRTAQEIMNDRIGIAKQTAQSLHVTVILKGACSVIADPTGRVSINPTGNPGMATAGSGDVLTGILSALISQRLPVWDAARLGVYLHGLAGDLGAKAMGQHSLIAGDLIDHLPDAFLQVRQTCRQRD